ncbi:MAG TPA: hypothetical protein VNM34_10585 [Verrucomicrobiae bacterium]|nr:hypothetical protein [Verrucomicrobiae bacterium]
MSASQSAAGPDELGDPLVFPLSPAGVLPDAGFASELDAPSPPEAFALPDPESPPPPASEPELDPLSAAADAALEAEREAELRSFFAQPLPRKWIVGAENAFRTGPAPHTGQLVGPSAVTEWMTSNRWPFGQM